MRETTRERQRQEFQHLTYSNMNARERENLGNREEKIISKIIKKNSQYTRLYIHFQVLRTHCPTQWWESLSLKTQGPLAGSVGRV